MEETVSRIQRRNSSRHELQVTFARLNNFIQTLNDKIVNRIQLVQQVYLQDYKNQVKTMAEQLKNIRQVLDEELLRQRSNERLFYLEEERDFFRGQVMKLNTELTNLNKSNLRLKEQLDEAQAQAKNYKNLVYGLQKKIMKMESEAFETQQIRQMPSSVSVPNIHSKQSLSGSPTKASFSKTAFDGPITARVIHRSVELRKSLSKQMVDGQVNKKQQILEQCIKNVKKKIFYRTLNNGEQSKKYFDIEKKVPFDRFTRTDKEDLVRSILCNPEILQKFYQYMTSKTDASLRKSIKLPNPQGKTNFNQKIFKIKLSGLHSPIE